MKIKHSKVMKLRHFYFIALFFCFILVFSTCASSPKVEKNQSALPFAEKFDKFIISKTSETDVINSVGLPYKKEKKTDGTNLYYYECLPPIIDKVSGRNIAEDFIISFDSNAIVVNIDRKKLEPVKPNESNKFIYYKVHQGFIR